jgi:hypothetical protein
MRLFFIAVLLGMLVIAGYAQEAQECLSTLDCVEGYCFDGKCVAPVPSDYVSVKGCNRTAQCYEGYCLEGKCVIPTSSTKMFSFGVKNGCAGLFTGNLGGFDIVVCNAVWIILIALSLGAAYISRESRNKLVPFVVFLIPVGVGGMTYPFLGAVFAIGELLFFVYGWKREKEEE